jgi:enterochelin esterase family protein
MIRHMRKLLVLALIAACSSSASAPSPPPSPSPSAPPAAEAANRPPADKLEAGHPVERTIKSGEVHRYRIEVPAGNTALGAVVQDGIDLMLTAVDPSGKKLGDFDSPNGAKGPEPFSIEATAAGAYDIEVRPFEEPGAGSGGRPPVTGRYVARLDEIVTADAFAERKAKQRIASPHLLEVWRAARTHKSDAIDRFWAELKGKAPLVEPYPGDAKDVLVSFVLRSPGPYVAMAGGPDFREKPLVRIPDSDVWFLTARMPADARFDYVFLTADGPPDYFLPFQKEPGPNPRTVKQLPDPNNPATHFDLSRAELPGAPPQPWIVAKPEVAKGKITVLKLDSALLKESRRVGVYTPPGFDAKQRYPLLIVFDGEVYGLDANALVPVATILDNLIAARKIPPIVAALVANQGTRDRDLPGSEAFSAFVAKELVPRLRADYRAGMTPADTIVTGSSFGGLCSTFTAFHHSDVIGNVLSQSGSYQFVRGSIGADISRSVEGGWLIRDIAAAPKRPIRFYLDAGLFEENLLTSNRHLRDVLVAKGYPVTYAEFSGGHDYGMWRGTISDGLIALLRK